MKNTSSPTYNKTFREHLRLIHYWQNRFEVSRNIDHYDNAERHAEIAREYLPEGLRELSVIGLYNLHLCLPSLASKHRFGAW